MMTPISRSMRALPMLAFFASAFLVGCQDDRSDQTPKPSAPGAPGTVATDASLMARIPFTATAHNLLVDDIDGDGRLDLAFTSHHDNFSQVFLQTAPRIFAPGPRIEEVGFHPGQLMRLPVEGRRLYLMNAEGVNRLIVFEPTAGGGMSIVAQSGLGAPRHSTPFHWPDWDLGIAVAPYASSEIDLIKNFDPLTGKASGVAKVAFRPGVTSAHRVAAADLDGDGVDEILFANSISNAVSVIRAPAAGATPSVEQLWRFDPGGRGREVLPADIDQDGDMDLLVPDATDKRALDRTDVNVLVNDGKGGFEALAIQLPFKPRSAGAMTGVNTADFQLDQDGNGYLFAAGYGALTLMRIPAGWSGETPEMRTVGFKGVQAITEGWLRDIDGDGRLDILMSRSADRDSGLIIYGPLWSTLESLAADGAVIDW